MKRCSICKTDKDLTQFYKATNKKDGLQNKCKECSKASGTKYSRDILSGQRARRERKRAATRPVVFEYLSDHPCVDCGETDIRVLEFDHLPEHTKRNSVGRLVIAGYSLEVVLEEIAKCEVRCRNCHQIKTYERLGGSWHNKFLTQI